MDQETLGKELQRFNITDTAIAKLNADCMALTVKGVDDTPGYEIVKRARIDVKKLRVEVEKTRIALKAESLEYGRRIDGEAKRITALLEPIETHLIDQEKIVDDEKARIKAEAEAKETARIQARIDTICAFGASFNSQMYVAYDLQIPAALVKACTDEEFAQFIAQVQEKKDAEDARLKAEEVARLEEQTLILRVQQEQEAERQRLTKITREQEEEDKRLKAEQKKIDDAKQKALDDARRAEELETMRIKAVEQARIDVEAKIKRQVEEKAAADLRAKIAAEKKAARAPDKIKLKIFIETILAVPVPQMKMPEAEKVLVSICGSLGMWIKTMNEKIEEAL